MTGQSFDSADSARARIAEGDALKTRGDIDAAYRAWASVRDSPHLSGKEQARVHHRLAGADLEFNLTGALASLWKMATLAAEDLEGLPLAIEALVEIAAILEAKFPEGLPPAHVPTLGFRAERRDVLRAAAGLLEALGSADPAAAAGVSVTIPDHDAGHERARIGSSGAGVSLSAFLCETGCRLAAGEASGVLWALASTMAQEDGDPDAVVIAVRAQLETALAAGSRGDAAAESGALQEMCELLGTLRDRKPGAFGTVTRHVEQRTGLDLNELCPGIKLSTAALSSEMDRIASCPLCSRLPARVDHRGMGGYPPAPAFPPGLAELETVLEVKDLSAHRNATSVTRLLTCPVCGTYYHHQTYDDDGAFFMDPTVQEITFRRYDVATALAFLEAFVADPESALNPADGQLAKGFIDGTSRPTATIEEENRRRSLRAAGEALDALRARIGMVTGGDPGA